MTQLNPFEPRVMLRTRLVGEVHMSSGWFNASEPYRTMCKAKNKACERGSHEFGVVRHNRTFSNLRTRLVGEVHMSSGWFDASEPFRTTCNANNKACG